MAKADHQHVPVEGLAALRAYVDVAWPRIDALSAEEQLTLRDSIALFQRLEVFVRANMAMSPAMLSPADLYTLKIVARSSQANRGDIEALAAAIERSLYHR